jgi:hypothetical protein
MPLQYQTGATSAFDPIVAWILDHLQENLSIEMLAERIQGEPAPGDAYVSRRVRDDTTRFIGSAVRVEPPAEVRA